MNNEKAFLYDLCERTHTARVIGKLILEKLNIALQNAADHSLSGVNIELVNFGDEDIKISDKYKEDIIFSYPNELTKIYINVAKIPLPALSIRDFIHQYYLERNLDSSFTCNEISLSWNQYIEEYISSQTKASEDIAEPYDGGCIDVNKVIKDIESFLQTCSKIRKTKYIHLSIIFCDLNLEEDIFDGDLDDMTYTIKLPNNDRCQAFLGDIYQYFQNNDKYDIEFRPVENLSENRRYEISYHIEDKIDDTNSTSDTIARSEKITAETLDRRLIIENDQNRIDWVNINNYLNYHLIEQNESYVYINIQSGSENINNHPIRVEDNTWRLDIQLHELDSSEVMAGYVCEYCTNKGYDIRLSATAYNDVGRVGYMLYKVTKKK